MGQAQLTKTKRIQNQKLQVLTGQKRLNAVKKAVTETTRHSTIWSTKSCTQNDPSGARFGAQKVARETALSGARFGAQKVARETTLSGARFGAQKVARETTLSGARFGAQKVARETAHPEHDLEHKKLHAKRPIRSTIWSTKSCTRNDTCGARKLAWLGGCF